MCSIWKAVLYGSILNFEAQLVGFIYKGSKNLRDIYLEPPSSRDVPSYSKNAVLGIVPGMLGTVMCDAAVEILNQQVLPKTLRFWTIKICLSANRFLSCSVLSVSKKVFYFRA